MSSAEEFPRSWKSFTVVPRSVRRIKKHSLCPCGLPWLCSLSVFSHISAVKTSSLLANAGKLIVLWARSETSSDASPRGFPRHRLAYIRVKPLLVLARLGALRDVFVLTSVSCLSSIGPVRAMEPWLTWMYCLGWQPNHLAPCQTPAGPKLRQHNRWALKGPTTSALLQEDEEEDEGGAKETGTNSSHLLISRKWVRGMCITSWHPALAR